MTESEMYVQLIRRLLEKITDPRRLAMIYRYINRMYCQDGE